MHLRSKLTYANVVATLALFLALSGGVVWAAGKIKSNDIAKNGVKAKNIAKNAVTAKKIKKGSITAAKFASGAGSAVVANSTTAKVAATAGNGTPLPLTPPVGFKLTGKQIAVVVAEGSATTAGTGAMFSFCNASVIGQIDGQNQGGLFFTNASATPATTHDTSLIGVVTTPGTHQVGLTHSGGTCSADSTVGPVGVQVYTVG
jgi:hypothetical protein